MIKAEELRIGSLLMCAESDNTFECTIEDLERIYNGSSKARYVPLTEEWAVKFGFECLVDMAFYITSNSKYRVEITSKDLIDMKVYEAQNLFRCLTGEELTINE